MVRIILTAILLLHFYQPVQSAVIREQFAQTVDYVGWQIMDAYMQDYLSIRPNQVAERAGYEAFQQEFSRGEYSIEQPPNSQAVATFLENNDWRNASTNLYRRIISIKEMYRNEWTESEAIDFLQQQIRNISLQPLNVASEDDYEQLQQTKALLIQEIQQYLSIESSEAASAAVEDESLPPPTTAETDVTATSDSPDLWVPTEATDKFSFLDERWFQLIPLILSLLSIGLSLYIFSLLRKQDARIDRHTKRIEELTARQLQKSTPYVTREEVAQLKNRVKEAEAQVASLRKQLPKKKETDSQPRFGLNTPPAPVTKSYYLSTPNSDGTFPAGSMSAQFRPSASIYHFEVLEQNGENTATFTVANNADAMKDALSSPGSYLEPVCESENSYFAGAQRIVNVEPGKATQQGDQWVVFTEDKALIRYE